MNILITSAGRRVSLVKAFQKELSQYKTGKGSIQFPYSQPLPLDLIAKIVKFRVEENQQKADLKKTKK